MPEAADWRTLYVEIVGRVTTAISTAGWNLRLPVRACPDWTARDLLGHLAGITEDWVAGRLDFYATAGWTNDQVQRHEGDEPSEVLATWSRVLEQLQRTEPHALMGEPWPWLFGDALAHEADLYETFDPARRPPPGAVEAGLARSIGRWRQHLNGADVPPIEVVVPGVRSWWVGRPAPGHHTLRADAYDIWRFLMGRTAIESVRRLDWSSDPACYLDLGLAYPFEFPAEPSL